MQSICHGSLAINRLWLLLIIIILLAPRLLLLKIILYTARSNKHNTGKVVYLVEVAYDEGYLLVG